MTVTVRFAPSPTGYLHIGNARTALFNWLYATAHDGQFILRLDDTDRERSRDEYAEAIEADLTWLEIKPHRIERQSSRFDRYDAVAEMLKERGLLYHCFETPDELERRRRRRRARGLPPIYDRAALALTAERRQALAAEGRTPHWRFLLPNFADNPGETRRTDVVWRDLCRGEQTVDLASLSDPVLIRADGTYLYTLPSVVDDIDMGVSHVIRGDDHVTNTAVQIALAKALDAEPPHFAHHNLLTTVGGEGLSKRSGALSLKSLREDGFEAGAVASLATLIGTAHPVEPFASLDHLSQAFDLSTVSRSPAKFDAHDLDHLNSRIVHGYAYGDIAERLTAMGIADGEAFWLAVRDNLEKIEDAATWWKLVAEPVDPAIDAGDRPDLAIAADLLPAEPWTEDTWSAWTAEVKARTGRKGRALFQPLRKALTGLDHGPELKRLLPLIGRQKADARLRGGTA